MKTFSWISALMMIFILGACNKDDDNNNGNPPAGNINFSVKLVDAPGAYDAVNVEIIAMEAKIDTQWIDLPVAAPGVYNLMDFTNGNSLLLIGDTSMAAGTMSELRLILGTNNTVVIDGISYEMQTPSGQTSGYKVKMDPQPMEPGGTYSLVIDFDVNKSVHETGNGKYMLKPVVRGYLETSLGGIAGVVVPFTAAYYAEATNATDTAGAPIDSVTGEFLLSTVMPGTYNVTIYAADTAYSDTTISGIVVVAGQVTQMDTVVLQ